MHFLTLQVHVAIPCACWHYCLPALCFRLPGRRALRHKMHKRWARGTVAAGTHKCTQAAFQASRLPELKLRPAELPRIEWIQVPFPTGWKTKADHFLQLAETASSSPQRLCTLPRPGGQWAQPSWPDDDEAGGEAQCRHFLSHQSRRLSRCPHHSAKLGARQLEQVKVWPLVPGSCM